MKSISNQDAATIIRTAEVLAALRPEGLRERNAIRMLRQVAARLARKGAGMDGSAPGGRG